MSERHRDETDGRPAERSSPSLRVDTPIVLVVDDVEDNRDLYAMQLTRLGYRVELAVDGADGVARARAVRPNVILMDLAMPNVDGFEATRRIRAISRLASIRIIAISAFTDATNTQRALAAGCDEVLTKPCASDVLAARVEAGVRASRASHSDRN